MVSSKLFTCDELIILMLSVYHTYVIHLAFETGFIYSILSNYT